MKKEKGLLCPPCPCRRRHKSFELIKRSEKGIFLHFFLNGIYQSKTNQNKKKALQWIKNVTEDVDAEEIQRKIYFKDLYNLFTETKWNHLQQWDKLKFFKLWLTAISEEYMQAYIKCETLYRQHIFKEACETVVHNKVNQENLSPLIQQIGCGVEWIGFHKDVVNFYLTTLAALGLPIDAAWRREYLSERWSKEGLERYKLLGFGSKTGAWETSFNEMNDLLNLIEPYQHEIQIDNPEISSVHLSMLDVKYPKKVILKEVEKIIDKYQKIYFSKRPEEKHKFIKEDKTGRADTYPFEDWARYLEIYMLKQQGIKTRELVEQFYSKKHLNPERQVLRDNSKAKKLLQNAVAGDFPGKY